MVIFTLGSASKDVSPEVSSRKKEQLAASFEARLRAKLEPVRDDEVAFNHYKKRMLKSFSDELEMNVLFDADEKRQIIQDLAGFTLETTARK